MDTIVYVITHKKVNIRMKKYEYNLLVGSFDKDKSEYEGYFFDDENDNISVKNKYYCELTGLYWIWKNSTSQIIGLEHYRRFFSNNKFSGFFAKTHMSKSKIVSILNKYDIILPYPMNLDKSNYEFYCEKHFKGDINLIRKIIQNNFPEYVDSFDIYMNNSTLVPFNMFISKKKLIDKYCEWLFSIFDIFENISDEYKTRDTYQQRIFGFLSERLFNVWIMHNKLQIKYQYVRNTDEKIRDKLKYKFTRR